MRSAWGAPAPHGMISPYNNKRFHLIFDCSVFPTRLRNATLDWTIHAQVAHSVCRCHILEPGDPPHPAIPARPDNPHLFTLLSNFAYHLGFADSFAASTMKSDSAWFLR